MDHFKNILEQTAKNTVDIKLIIQRIESRNNLEPLEYGWKALQDAQIIASEELEKNCLACGKTYKNWMHHKGLYHSSNRLSDEASGYVKNSVEHMFRGNDYR